MSYRLDALLLGCMMVCAPSLTAQDGSAPGVLAPIAICRGETYGLSRCINAVEDRAIAQAGGRVVRRDTLLVVQTQSAALAFADRNVPGEAYVRHVFAGQLPNRRYALVERHRYEDHEYLLIDWRSADSTHLPAPPLLSPDAMRIAVASRDEEGWFAYNRVEVWRLDATRPVMEFSAEGGIDCEPARLRWADERTIEFVWVDERRGRRIPAKLTRDGSEGWRLDPLPHSEGQVLDCHWDSGRM